MKIIEELKKRADSEKADDPEAINIKLVALIQTIKKDVDHHLTQINSQMRNFDIHDSSHSDKILSNIEKLIGEEIINSLTNYELFLIYLSCYLHDCAMALPEWEIRLLRLTEGTELLDVPELRDNLKRDMKAPCTHTEALSEIENRKHELYDDFNKITEFLFLTKPESDFKSDLCSRLIEYQEFRNGYSGEMKKIIDEENKSSYLEMGEFIRGEFIRSTHAKRIEKYVQNLASKFDDWLGGAWGRSLAHDLAKICRSHGEDFEFVQKLEVQQSYYGKGSANLRFASIMLRLGDVLHFSFDRVSKSLLAEKMIDSNASLKHWKAKFQGLDYSLDEIDSDGKIKIKYMAFCDNPGSFYFIQDYINYIDDELGNYFKFIGALDYIESTKPLVEKYKLRLPEKVDRNQIRYDENKFIPVPNMGFTLNQNRILELLMGVGLYKDKYYSFREVYQNSLDACRCMIATYANEGIEVKGNIEFGLGKETNDGKERVFAYCLDNGIGMNKQIVQEYFLRIGNSYYNSREYRRRASKLKNSFQPISQFGIGILSCFMVADKLEITSIPLDVNRKPGDAIRFAVDGPHERFYYMNPNSFDIEKIGTHGTLIKLFLKPEESILNTAFIENLLVMNYGEHDRQYIEKHKEAYIKWNGNLFNLLNKMIGVVDERITLHVKFENDKKMELLPHFTPMDIFATVSDEELIKDLNRNRVYLRNGKNPTDDFLKYRDFVEIQLLKVEHKGIEYYTLLCLPKSNIPIAGVGVLSFINMLRERIILVDGIVTDDRANIVLHESLRELVENGIINIYGPERPQLSVDRTTITSLSEKLKELLTELPDKIANAIIEILEKHFRIYSIDKDSDICNIIWDYIFSKYSSITTQLLQILLTKSVIDIQAADIKKFINANITIREFAESQNITFNQFDYRSIGNISKAIMLSKFVDADTIKVQDSSVELITKKLSSLVPIDPFEDRYTEVVINADEWHGKYSEYDIVTTLWPIVPDRLFNRIRKDSENRIIDHKRAKQIHQLSNTLSGIYDLESVSIHPKIGLFKFDKSFPFDKVNRVGKFGTARTDYWFPEINGHYRKKQSKCYVVYAFISPSNLTEEEKISLEPFQESDPLYFDGVTRGLSILFLDHQCEYVVEVGIAKRTEMVKLIKEQFFEKNKDTHFAFLDDTPLR